MFHRVTLIPGDGIGPDVVEAARRAIDATGVVVRWEIHHLGQAATAREGTPLPASTLDAIRETGVALKGPVATPVGTGMRSINVALRQALDLYACIRPCKLYPGVASVYDAVDLVVVRENTEG
ncbi:MAG: isocitrate/isopropylmalate dehydrogenase family protein, partial [Actinobacteria bacterium]|nr:isocitrate/isopropylmalate dehydrogenase family protein [Actinomycetota bacterium]